MSTNYYWYENTYQSDHIGKRYGAGDGKCGFIFAIPREDIESKVVPSSKKFIAVNEYGTKLTGDELFAIINDCVKFDTDSIGKRFF